jgi:hypothetical protein
MPWGGKKRIDRHKAIPYAETKVVVPMGMPFTVTSKADGKREILTISGTCPACGGSMSKEFSVGVGGSGTKGGRKHRLPAAAESETIYCECGRLHPDRPDGATDDGCGRYWDVDLPTS